MTCPTTCLSRTRPVADAARDALLRATFVTRAASLVRQAWRAYWDWRARRVTVLILSSLDARTLHDIGISPSEIESLVQCSNGRRRRYDAAWLWRCGGS